MSNKEPEKENKTLLSKDELSRAINKLKQFMDVDDEDDPDDLPEYLRQKNNQEDYVEEVKKHENLIKLLLFFNKKPLVIDNLKDIAREIAELASQNEELTKRIMKHQKNRVLKLIFIIKLIKKIQKATKSS